MDIVYNKMLHLESAWSLVNENEFNKDDLDLDDLLVEISLKFINFRIDNKLTQKQLAEMLEVSQVMVSKFESGDYNPSVGQLLKISKKLGWFFNLDIKTEVKCTWDEEKSDDLELDSDEEKLERYYLECA